MPGTPPTPDDGADPLRVVARADRAYHDVAQYHLSEFEPTADGGDVGRDGDGYTESGRTGPFIFGHPTAREQLRDHGIVHTFRVHDRTTGRSWWRASRTGPKEGEAVIAHAAEIAPTRANSLHPYQPTSGFESLTAWRAAIAEIHGGVPDSGHVFQVRDPEHPRYAGDGDA